MLEVEVLVGVLVTVWTPDEDAEDNLVLVVPLVLVLLVLALRRADEDATDVVDVMDAA